jgi:hypothetical protein
MCSVFIHPTRDSFLEARLESEIHPTSFSTEAVHFISRVRESDHSPPSSVEVKNIGATLILPHISLWNMFNYLSSSVSTTEELLERKSRISSLENRD